MNQQKSQLTGKNTKNIKNMINAGRLENSGNSLVSQSKIEWERIHLDFSSYDNKNNKLHDFNFKNCVIFEL